MEWVTPDSVSGNSATVTLFKTSLLHLKNPKVSNSSLRNRHADRRDYPILRWCALDLPISNRAEKFDRKVLNADGELAEGLAFNFDLVR